MYEKIKKYYNTRNTILSTSAIGVIIAAVLSFFNQELGSSIGASVIICLLSYLLILIITFPLRLKGEWKEYKAQIKQELKEEAKETFQKMKNKEFVPKKPVDKGLIIYLVCVFIVFIIPKNGTSTHTFSTYTISKEIQNKLKNTPWADMVLEKATQGNNYSSRWTGVKPERSISILEIETNYITVSTYVNGNLFDPQDTYKEIQNSFIVFEALFPEDQSSIISLKDNLNEYINTMFKSARQEGNFTVFDSIEKKVGNIILTTGAQSDIQGIITNGSFYVSLNKYLQKSNSVED